MTTFKKRLREKAPLLGTLAALGSVEAVELLSHAGLDFIWIDAEHSAIGIAEVQAMVRAVAERCATLVRVPSNDEAWIKKVLDTGCDGVIVPQVNSAEEARRAVACCYYPPRGRRSVGGSRAQAYGFKSAEYFARANESIAVIVQAEHRIALESIDQIAQVEGVDAVFVGPIDLSASLGLMGQLSHPDVQQAVQLIADSCKRHSMPLGIYARDTDSAKSALASGFIMVALGTDAGYLRSGISQSVSLLRKG